MQHELARHRYKKVNDKYEIFETTLLTYQKFDYIMVDDVMASIKSQLTPKMLRPKYRQEAKTNLLRGHCYHSCQALFHLMDKKLDIMRAPDSFDDWHWWLQDGKKILDITAEQYYNVGKVPPYEDGKKAQWTGFRGRPQRNTLCIMRGVLGDGNFREETEQYIISELNDYEYETCQ